MLCIETNNLSYKFSGIDSVAVLNDINLQVPKGSIFGFLGPNGAGKTTTLRLLLGLLKKQSGTIKIFDKQFDASRIEILKDIGSLIEAPSLYAHLTATENLIILQKIYQCPKTRIQEVLKIVGLSDTGNKKAGEFSLGMKQRLSIAIALLHNPTLLILDEPTNGLDPNGIIEIRELLKKLNAEFKTTILISSHLLAEIEKLVSHICIINKGSILFQGTLDELHLKQSQTSVIYFDTDNSNKTLEIIKSNNLVPSLLNGRVTIPIVEKEIIAKLNQQLVNNKIAVYQIAEIKNDLESIFIDITKN
jgi:ABC-2 type transport system ATP-binding protein